MYLSEHACDHLKSIANKEKWPIYYINLSAMCIVLKAGFAY